MKTTVKTALKTLAAGPLLMLAACGTPAADSSVDWNVPSMLRAIFSIEPRSTPGRSTPICSSASHASRGKFS